MQPVILSKKNSLRSTNDLLIDRKTDDNDPYDMRKSVKTSIAVKNKNVNIS